MSDFAESEEAVRQMRREYDQLNGEMEAAIEQLQMTNEEMGRIITELEKQNDDLRTQNDELREEVRTLRARLGDGEVAGPRLTT